MNANDTDKQPLMAADEKSDEGVSPAATPRRRPRKSAEAQADVAVTASVGGAEAAPAGESPKPRRRSTRAPQPEQQELLPLADGESVVAEPAVRAPRRRRAPEAVEAVVASEPAPAAEAGELEAAEAGADAQTFEAADQEPQLTPEQLQALAQERFAQVLTGEFDVEDAAPEGGEAALASADAAASGQPAKRVLAPEPDAPKLQKVLAQAGVGSRRDIEELIAQGKITVNGDVAHVGQRISFGDKVVVAGRPIRVRIAPPAPRILAYHKPVGEVVTFNDPEGRPTVFRSLPRLPQGKWQSVGRLDLNTEGLLLFTNSGELANQLMHPRFGVEREYAVRVLGTLSNEQKASLLAGVEIEGQAASFKSITDGGGEGVNRWYRVVITEGRNREVRKLFETVGLAVSRLIRIRYGTVVLPRGLRRGVYVELGDADVRVIRQLAGGGQSEPRQARGADRQDRNKRRRGGASGGPRPSRPEPRQEAPRQDMRPVRPQQEPRVRRDSDEDSDDFIPRHINPLEQTFDRRFVSNGKSRNIPAGFGRGGSDPGQAAQGARGRGGRSGGGAEHQPDPLQTTVGYIGADAFHNRGGRGGRRGGGGGGGNGGGGRGRR
ncbi:pseudouridine synthase [Roseateles sp. BYS180W]|uniref:Pseudouridine synthase n=1 Tax=Roseateles rivi TaxID=3299028 RepID=A0ABW7FVU8_9BURK